MAQASKAAGITIFIPSWQLRNAKINQALSLLFKAIATLPARFPEPGDSEPPAQPSPKSGKV